VFTFLYQCPATKTKATQTWMKLWILIWDFTSTWRTEEKLRKQGKVKMFAWSTEYKNQWGRIWHLFSDESRSCAILWIQSWLKGKVKPIFTIQHNSELLFVAIDLMRQRNKHEAIFTILSLNFRLFFVALALYIGIYPSVRANHVDNGPWPVNRCVSTFIYIWLETN